MGNASARCSNLVLRALATAASALVTLNQVDEARPLVADFMAASRSRGWEWLVIYADMVFRRVGARPVLAMVGDKLAHNAIDKLLAEVAGMDEAAVCAASLTPAEP